jgi:uncharacterized cupredoxin-like copper-binding protein
MKFARTAALLALAILTVVAIACGGDGGDEPSGTVGDDGVREITIRMTDAVRFEPASINLKAGEPVRLVIDNSEAASIHDFTVKEMPVANVNHEGEAEGGHAGMDASDEYDLHLALESGHDGVLEFTPTESGEYEFLCTVTGHFEAGMTGTLNVS